MTLTGQPFESLWLAGVTGVLGAWLGWRQQQLLSAGLLAEPLHIPALRLSRPQLVGLGLGAVVLLGAGGAFVITMNAWPLWGAALALALTGLSVTRQSSSPCSPPAPNTAQGGLSDGLGLGLLCLICVLLYVLILRPDADDAFYLNLPIGLKTAPQGMLVSDTMRLTAQGGLSNLPLLGSNYRIEALPTLTAALSYLSGLSVLSVAHGVLPLIWCLTFAATLFVIGRSLLGRQGWILSFGILLMTFALAGSLQTYGLHGLLRFFHGKAVLISIIVPLITLIALQFSRGYLPFSTSLIALTGLQLAAVGLTANAVYIGPLALGLAVFAGLLSQTDPGAPFRHGLLRRGTVILAALPALAAGIYLLLFDKPLSNQRLSQTPGADLNLWNITPQKYQFALLLGLISIAAMSAWMPPRRRWPAAYLIGALLFVFNPVLWPLYSDHVTGGLNFRLYWAVPVPLFIALTGAVLLLTLRPHLPPQLRPAAAPALLTLAGGLAFASHGILGGRQDVRLDPSLHKVPEAFATAEATRTQLSPGQMVLAPETISAWLPTTEPPSPTVYVRRLYLDQLAGYQTLPSLPARQQLAAWINEDKDALTSADQLTRLLDRFCVGLVILPTTRRLPTSIATLFDPTATDGTDQTYQMLRYTPSAPCPATPPQQQ